MIAALSLALLAAVGQVPARQSRAAFVAALAQVEDGWAKSQVEELLGKPDDIWPANDSPIYSQMGRETWCYGSKGHHSLPTLGRVIFEKNTASFTVGGYGTPPPASVIDEDTLDAALRAMDRKQEPGWDASDESAHLIRVANLLIGLGDAKALPVLREYSRVASVFSDDDWLFWVVRVAFELKEGQKGFRPPGLGAMSPAPPVDLSTWPTYPLLIVDDYPLNFYRGASLAGRAEPFESYLEDESKNWKLRTKQLTPPDDPFALREKVLANPVWEVMHQDGERGYARAIGLGEICKAVVSGLRSCYRPGGDSSRYYEMTQERYEELHSEFLALNCHWDAKRNCYVRSDGTVLNDEIIAYPQVTHVFRGVPHLKLEVTLSRYLEKTVNISCEVEETGKALMPRAALVAEDSATGKQLFWMGLNGDVEGEDYWATENETLEQFLAKPAHKSFGSGMWRSTGFDLHFGTKIRLVVVTGGKRYESPVLAP
jgi:hypothetical protein